MQIGVQRRLAVRKEKPAAPCGVRGFFWVIGSEVIAPDHDPGLLFLGLRLGRSLLASFLGCCFFLGCCHCYHLLSGSVGEMK
jgi:hypothetical protein